MKDKESDVQEFIRSLSLADDILFSVAFNRNIPATEHLVRTILSRPDITIASATPSSLTLSHMTAMGASST